MSKPAVQVKTQEVPVFTLEATPSTPPSTEPSAVEQLLETIKKLQTRLDLVEGRQEENYPDDSKLFIAKPNGEQWSERRIDPGSKSYIEVEARATAFYGPFATPEAAAAYLEAKKGRRDDSHITWGNVYTVTGAEKRKIEAEERADRERDTLPAKPAYFGGLSR